MSNDDTDPALRYHVLGPLEIVDADGGPVELAASKPRALLCALLVAPRQAVSLDRLIEHLWADEAPPAATATLQAYIAQLRRLLEPSRGPRQPSRVLVTRPPGYALMVAPGAIDAEQLVTLSAQGEALGAEGRHTEALARFEAALDLVRGRPFSDIADSPLAVGPAARLDQLILTAREKRLDTMLMLGRAGAAIADLESLVHEHPLHERFWAQLVEALYRSDRQADALRAFQTCRRRLVDELGVEPSPALRQLEQAVLTHAELPVAAANAPATPSTVVAASPASEGARGGPAVGRDVELEQLEQRLLAAAGGRGAIVIVEGESGIGKSYLAEAAVGLAERAGMACVWTTCIDELGAPTLWPWEQALGSLGLAPPDPVPGTSDSGEAQFRRMVDVLGALAEAARQRPVLLVIDDAQWADVASLRALRVLASRLDGARIVVLATVRRPDHHARAEVDDLVADLGRQRNVIRIRLTGLTLDGVGQLASRLLGDVAADVVEVVAARSSGNPFFATELLRLLDSERRIDGTRPGALGLVPVNVREVVERRIARLPDDTATMLRLAAVARRTIELAVAERATGLPADRVVQLMDVAVASGLMVEDDEQMGWNFAHALVQDAVRETLSRGHRARLHATLTDAIAAVHAEHLDEHLDDLAFHSAAAAPLGHAADAVAWSTRAALHARARGHHDVAARRWAAALDLVSAHIEPAQRFELLLERAHDTRAAGDVTTFAGLVTEAIDVAHALRDPLRVARAAAELGWVNLWNTRPYGSIDPVACAELERLAEAAAEADPVLAAKLFGAVGVELYYGPDRAHGEQLACRAVELARPAGDPVLLSRTLNNFVLAAWVPGADARRLAALDESLALRGRGLPAATEAVALLHRSAIRLSAADLAGAQADLVRCDELVADLALLEITAQLRYAQCGLAILHGQWGDADRLGDEAWQIHARTNLWGADYCRLTRLVSTRDAEGRLDEIVDEVVTTAAEASMIPLRGTAAMAVARAGDLAGARRLCARWNWRDEPSDWSWDQRMADWGEAAALCVAPGMADLYAVLAPSSGRVRVAGTGLASRGVVDGVLALLAASVGDRQAARRHGDAAVAASRRIGAHWWAARVEDDLAALSDPA